MDNNGSNDLYNYLIQNYDNVTLENGYYHIENTSGYQCEGYIPTSYRPGDVIDVYTFTPGTHQKNGGKVAVREYINKENTPDCAMFICYDYTFETSENNIVQHAANFAKDNGMVIANLGSEAFSGGGGNMLQYVAQFASNPENAHTNVTAVMSEAFPEVNFQGSPGVTRWNYKISDDVYTTLAENNVRVFGVSNPHNQQFGSGGRDYYLGMAKKGVHMVFIQTNETDHLGTLEASVENGLVFYLMGITDNVGDYAPHSKCSANYQPYVLVDGRFVQVGELSDYVGVDNKIYLREIDLDSIDYDFNKYGTSNGSSVVTTTKTTINDKYLNLKNLDHLSINYNDGQVDAEVATNMDYILSSVNSIRDQIKNSGFMQGFTKQSFSSSSGIPGCLSAYIDTYYDIMCDLMDRVAEQTEAIVSYGQAYVDMDLDLASKANGLSTGSIVELEVPSRFIKKEPEVPVTSAPTPATEEETTKPSGQKPSSGSPSGGYPSGGGTPTGSVPATPTTPSEPTEPAPTPTEPEHEPEGANLIEMERADGSRAIAIMDGDKVKELKYVYEYETIDDATNNLESISKKYLENKLIKEVVQNENKVEVIFKEEAFNELDLDAVIEKYFVDELE